MPWLKAHVTFPRRTLGCRIHSRQPFFRKRLSGFWSLTFFVLVFSFLSGSFSREFFRESSCDSWTAFLILFYLSLLFGFLSESLLVFGLFSREFFFVRVDVIRGQLF
jgi:hypothetical protein